MERVSAAADPLARPFRIDGLNVIRNDMDPTGRAACLVRKHNRSAWRYTRFVRRATGFKAILTATINGNREVEG